MTPRKVREGTQDIEEAYKKISHIVRKASGISLGPEKKALIKARVNRRIEATKSLGLADYITKLEGPLAQTEVPALISAMTTNYTNFFREQHHFDILEREAKAFIKSGNLRNLTLWSAGCSSGQEPVSIAITLLESLGYAARSQRVFATDIDTKILDRANEGMYTEAEISSVPRPLVNKYFNTTQGLFQTSPQVRDILTYRELNLTKPWKHPFKFDFIFCRNVAIYFDTATQNNLWNNMRESLNPGGIIFIGHSERLPDEIRAKFTPIAPTAYRFLDH